MMTEIQWIIHLMMNHDLTEPIKKLCLERIGEVEAKMIAPMVRSSIPNPLTQLSQAQLKDMAQSHVAHATVPASSPIPITDIPSEVVTSMGNGTSTRGPSKFKR